MSLSRASIPPEQILEARKQFVVDQFNEAGITDNKKHLVDVFYAIKDEPEKGELYLGFLLKVMGT
jgi:hypothetical protein